LAKGPEYETVWAHGANCEISDPEAIALMAGLEDDYGVDTIETGTAIAVAMQAGIIAFGDKEAAIELVKEIGKGTPLGKIIGSGAVSTGDILGVDHVPAVKGQALPAYDPRAVLGIGVTFATSPMGADHTAGFTIVSNLIGSGEVVDPLQVEGQVELSRNLQIVTAAIDSLGLCIFVAFCLLDRPDSLQALCDMVSARQGHPFTVDDLTALGTKILKTEKKFNRDAGFTEKDDRLPDFFTQEKLAPHQKTFLISDAELDQTLNL
jgi:aldehyde:ferredoxin oxidoreductase